MSSQRVFAIVLLVVGIIVFMVGMNARSSAADSVSNAFTGRYTRDTAWYLIGGGTAALMGLLMLLSGLRGRSA